MTAIVCTLGVITLGLALAVAALAMRLAVVVGRLAYVEESLRAEIKLSAEVARQATKGAHGPQ